MSSFSVWLLSSGVIILRCIHVVGIIKKAFLMPGIALQVVRLLLLASVLNFKVICCVLCFRSWLSRYDNHLRAHIVADVICPSGTSHTTDPFFHLMAWWISFTLIHTKAVLLNQSKKGSCMNQSQNAIFTSPMGEENLMNNNHKDSESITGESNLISKGVVTG